MIDKYKLTDIVLEVLTNNAKSFYSKVDPRVNGVYFHNENAITEPVKLFLRYSNDSFDKVDINDISDKINDWVKVIRKGYGKNKDGLLFTGTQEDMDDFMFITDNCNENIRKAIDLLNMVNKRFNKSDYSKLLEPVIKLIEEYIKKLERVLLKVIEISDFIESKLM